MKTVVSSYDILKWLNSHTSIDHESNQIINNMNIFVSLLIKNKVYDTSIGNYIFLLLSIRNQPELVTSSANVIETLSMFGGHYTVSCCVEKIEQFIISHVFNEIEVELADSILSSLYYLMSNHSHLLSLKFVQCVGILITDVLYSDTTSFYKLNNGILKIKSPSVVLHCLKISHMLFKNGFCFLDRIDRLENYCILQNEKPSSKIKPSPLDECLVGSLGLPANDAMHFQIVDLVRLIKSESDSISNAFIDKVMVFEIVEYVQEICDPSSSDSKRPASPVAQEFKKFKLDLEEPKLEESKNNAQIDDLLSKFRNNELQLQLE
jgi:Tfp pilus assembly protein PilZ